MPDSIQEQIVKKIAAKLALISTVTGASNTIASVQRVNQEGVDMASVPTILLKEGDCSVEPSAYPNTRRRMELFAVVVTRQDETPASEDTRSGGELLNSLIADIEFALQNNRTWDGLAIQTDAPSYLDVEMDAVTPHLSRGMRFEVLYEHLRQDPYRQA